MTSSIVPPPRSAVSEETLDPADWEEFRALGHRALDDMVDYLRTLRSRPAWQPMPGAVEQSFREPLPLEPQGLEQTYGEFTQRILPYPVGNLHPRFWGWVQGNGTPVAMLADMLAAGLNPHLAGFNQAPALVEHQVLEWLRQLMGMPEGSSGLLASGATMANIIALVVARNAGAGFDVRARGLQGADVPRLTLYCSAETHGWVQKGAELLGLGHEALRRIPVTGSYQMDLRRLREAISADRRAGHRPFAVVGSAGTVNTGAIDDLEGLAIICREENLWFHIDGAFGALARLSPEHAHLVRGLERADSLALDLHKWMYLPFEVACVLVRDAEAHRAAFALAPSYIAGTSRGVIAGGLPFADRGIELSRGFKALKVWMSLKTHGVRAIGRVIGQNIAQVQALALQIEQHPELELLAPVVLNVACFRYAPPGLAPERLNPLNQELLLRIQEAGVAVPSGTVLEGRYALRVANVNHRTRREDFEALLEATVRIGREVAQAAPS